KPDFNTENSSFLRHSSNRYFNERPFIQHECYIMLTKKSPRGKWSNSQFSNLIRPRIVPSVVLDPTWFSDFLQHCREFIRILKDSGFVEITQITKPKLLSTATKIGFLERYFFLSAPFSQPMTKDLMLSEVPMKIGDQLVCLYSISKAHEL